MATSVLAPLHSTFLGFDRLFNDIDHWLATAPTQAAGAGYPPLNIYREQDGYSIEIALAGFKKTDIRIEHDRKRSLLTVSGDATRSFPQDKDSATSVSREVVKQGIASRKFTRSFTVADDLEVLDANLEDGLLLIRLKQFVREEDKPLLIPLK